VEVVLALGAVEKLNTFQVGLVLTNLAGLSFSLLTDEVLSFLSKAIILRHRLKLG
jgi:hypothetical protein